MPAAQAESLPSVGSTIAPDGATLLEILPSGLSLVAELHGEAPVVSVQVWVGAGGSSDPSDGSGAAHLLEHMVFKGAGDQTGAQLTQNVEAVGGDLNAWTSVDQTCFHVTVPTSAFEVAARALGAMAFVPWLRADDLTPELGVVVEEIRGADDDPSSLLGDRMRAAMWGDHPGGRPVLGTEASVTSITADDLRAFHRRQYHPTRMAFVVAGPVPEDRVRAMALELDGWVTTAQDVVPEPIPPVPEPFPARPGVELVQLGHEDRVLEVAFPGPGPDHPDQAPLDVLTVCLGDGGGARLVRALRDEAGVAVTAWAAMEIEQVAGMVALGATPREGRELDTVRELGRQLVRMQDAGPTLRELVRARGLVRSDALKERETVDGRANRLGWYWNRFGDLAAEQAYMDAIARVTVADVQRAARTWLDPKRAVVGLTTGDETITEAKVAAAWAEGTRPMVLAQAAKAAELVTRVLPGGLQVSVESRPGAELLGVSMIGLGGNIAEPTRRAGLSSAWSRMLMRGAGELSTPALAELVEARSGSASVWNSRNSVGVEVVWPGDGLAWLGWLLHEMLVAPRWMEEELAHILDDLRIDRELAHDDPGTLAWDGVFADLYPEHPWGRPAEGSAGGLERIDLPALKRYHQKVTAAANLKVAVSGPVDPDEVFAVLAPLSRSLPAGPAVGLRPPVAFGQKGGSVRKRRVPRRDAQAQVAFGIAGAGLGVGGADEGTARVLEAVLSGARGGGGRLFQRIREELGLAYSVGSSWEGGLGAGAMLVYAGTDPTRVPEVLDALWTTCCEVGTRGIEATEWDRVRSGLSDGIHIGLQRSVARARNISAAAAYRGDPTTWQDTLTVPLHVEQGAVEALARRLFAEDQRVVVTAGPRTRSW